MITGREIVKLVCSLKNLKKLDIRGLNGKEGYNNETLKEISK